MAESFKNKKKNPSSAAALEQVCLESKGEFLDWVSILLRYQAQNNGLLEYILTEAENGRQ
jgi:hypothetical protein